MREYSTERIFYVYHHINENLEISEVGCRYIGKGKGKRAYKLTNRNLYWQHIFTKDNPPTVVLIAENLTEEEAFEIEKWQIALAKEHSVKLCNLTDGGEGSTGCHPSLETRKKIGKASTGRKHSIESIMKMSIGLIKTNKNLETKRKRSEANRKRLPPSDETRRKMTESKKNQSLETRRKNSEAHKGKHPTDATREKMKIARKNRQPATAKTSTPSAARHSLHIVIGRED